MKVYAHYFKSKETENEYRWRTLLQFGTSWEVIGSIVMKNPGSALPLTPDKPIEDEKTLSNLRLFCSDYPWYAFGGDHTIGCVIKLFRAYYETKFGNPDLNGVIQIFNLINVRDKKVENACEKVKKEELPFSRVADKDIAQLIAPVYLGWGSLDDSNPLFPLCREDAEKIFHTVHDKMDGKYLHVDFEKNLFRHPQYMMGVGCKNPDSKYILHAFCQNTENPSY